VVGASYTSLSFFRTLLPVVEKNARVLITVFILLSTALFLSLGKAPVSLLVLAGAVNGFILPIALAIILIAARKKKAAGLYPHPLWMEVAGWLVVLLMAGMSGVSVVKMI
jgi:Mn2+/Fe2+ NRAMP family transporter